MLLKIDSYMQRLKSVAWPKKSDKIAHDDFVQHPKKHRYVQAKNKDGLFVNGLRDISFTSVVDDYGIQYTNKDDVNRLISVTQGKYKFKVDIDKNNILEFT